VELAASRQVDGIRGFTLQNDPVAPQAGLWYGDDGEQDVDLWRLQAGIFHGFYHTFVALGFIFLKAMNIKGSRVISSKVWVGL